MSRVTIPGCDPRLDFVAVNADAALIKGMPALGWVDSSHVMAGTRAAPCLSIAGGVARPAHFHDMTAAATLAMLSLSEVTVTFNLGYLMRCADAMEGLKMFAVPLTHTSDIDDKLIPALARLPSPSPFEIRAGEMYEANAFMVPPIVGVAGVAGVRAVGRRGQRGYVPAVRAVAAVVGVPARQPAALEWWSLVTVGDSLDRTNELPMLALLQRGMAAPDRTDVSARDNPMGRVRLLSDTLYSHLGLIIGDEHATHARRARAVKLMGSRLRSLPDELRSGSFDPDILEAEAADDFSYARKTAQQDAVTVARLPHCKRAYDQAHDYLMRLSSGPSRRDTIINLTKTLKSVKGSNATLFARLDPLNSFLREQSPFIIQCLNKGTPLEGADGLTALLVKEQEEWSDPAPAPLLSADASDDYVPTASAVSDAAWRRALTENKAFVDVADKISALNLTELAGRAEAVELACLAKCSVFQRFFADPRQLLSRHEVFKSLHKCLIAIRVYVGRAQAADPVTGKISTLQMNWRPSEGSIKLAVAGKMTKFPFLNGPDGALALHNLSVSVSLVDVPEDQLYIVPAALELMIPFAQKTFGSLGWKATSTMGYTIHSLLNRQLKHVKYIRGLADLEQGTLLAESQLGFLMALVDSEAHVRNLLTDPEPASVVLDCVLPFGSNYDDMIARHLATAEPFVLLRQTFPQLMPTSAPRSVDGVVLPTPAPVHVPKDPKNPKDPKVKGGPSGKAEKPGSLKGIVKWLDDTHVQIGISIYDVAAICAYYKISIDDFCPACLSNKPGDSKFALCSKWGESGHEHAKSSAHTVPKGFNLQYISKHFMTKAETKPGGGGGKRKGQI